MSNIYCGMGPVPKGKVRGTPEYCLQQNQVRYYGIVAIDPELLENKKQKTSNLIKEQLKFKKIQDDAKILIKDVKNLRLILENDKAIPSDIKKAQKKLDDLLAKKVKLQKRLKDQINVVETIEKQQKLDEKSSKNKSEPKTVKKSSKNKSEPKKNKSEPKKNKSGSKTFKKTTTKNKSGSKFKKSN